MKNTAEGAWTLRRVAAGALVSLGLIALAVIGYASAGGLSSQGYYGYCPYGPYQYCPPTTTGPPPPPPREPDHYLKYLTDAPSRKGETLTLIDQFGTLRVQMEKPISLMVPAEKRRQGRPPEPINNPDDHLVCYKLPNELQSLNRTVQISNQFRSSTLRVGQPIELCAPASKSLTGPPTTPPTRLDHYLCYDVLSESPDAPSETMVAIDQFRSQSIRIDTARDLCNPVEKRRDGRPAVPITQPEIHFVCYRITTSTPSWRTRAVFTRDQFGLEQFRLPYQRRFCMPSSKLP